MEDLKKNIFGIIYLGLSTCECLDWFEGETVNAIGRTSDLSPSGRQIGFVTITAASPRLRLGARGGISCAPLSFDLCHVNYICLWRFPVVQVTLVASIN